MSLYIDYAIRRGATWLQIAKAQGVDGIARYYDGGRVPGKRLTLAEAQDAAAAGLRIHAVYETSGGADIAGFQKDGNYFTNPQGHQDWLEAVTDARAAGQPTGTPIFLSVDRHMPTDDPRLYAYFEGATQEDVGMGGSSYFIGCYAPDYICAYIRDTFGIQHLWPWLPRPPAVPDLDYDLWQQVNAATVAGARVDLNDCQLEGWTPVQEDPMPSETEYREWAKQEARAILAQEYGPALEAELQQRLAENSAADVGAAVVAAVKAVGAKLTA